MIIIIIRIICANYNGFYFFFLLEAVKRFRYKNYEYYSRIFLILFSFRFVFVCRFLFKNFQFARDKIVLKPLQTALTNYLIY